MSFIPIFLTIFIGRLNSSLLGYELLNTDEFVIASKAIRIIKSNFKFFEFDGDTSGVLNMMFLLWPSVFKLDITYLSIRLTAIIVISLILYYTYKIIKLHVKKNLSIILILPLILFFSLTKDPDFLHYSNELVTTLFIVFSLFIFFKNFENIKNYQLILVSFALGSVLFAKMQFFPVAVTFVSLIMYRFIFIKKETNKACVFCIGFILPTILLSFYYFINNEFLDLFYNVIHYPLSHLIASNLNSNLILAHTNDLISVIKSSKKTILINHLLFNSAFHLFYLYLIIFLFYCLKINSLNQFYKIVDFKIFLTSILIAIIFLIIIGTGSVHRHYTIILMPIIPIFISIFINRADLKFNVKIKSNIYFNFLLSLFFLSLIFETSKFYSANFKHSEFLNNQINFLSPKIFKHFKLDEKKDKLVVWGWKPEFYILSNLMPASRETVNQKQIDYKSNRKYFRDRFVKDFKKNKPSLIIDYVKPKGGYISNVKFGIDSFTEISELMRENFTKLSNENLDCPSFYLSNDKFADLQKKIINYSIRNQSVKLQKINDFNIDEEICDNTVFFSKDSEDSFTININSDKKLEEIMIMGSKNNMTNAFINLVFYSKNEIVKVEKINLKKYPHWTSLKSNENIHVDEIKFDVINLKKNNLGISEIKLYGSIK
jgi:hypothetical protein